MNRTAGSIYSCGFSSDLAFLGEGFRIRRDWKLFWSAQQFQALSGYCGLVKKYTGA